MLHGQVRLVADYGYEYYKVRLQVPQENILIQTTNETEAIAIDEMVRGLRKIGVTDKIRIYGSDERDLYTF